MMARPWSGRDRVVLAGLATALAAILVYAGPPGTDFAEHAFQEAAQRSTSEDYRFDYGNSLVQHGE